MTNYEEQKQLIDKKIEDTKAKSMARIYNIISREKDAELLAKLISEEKEKLNEKVEQLKAQKRAVDARSKTQQRKDRTRRLIQHGALAEKYLNCEGADTETFEKTLKEIVRTVSAGQQKS